MNTINTPIRIAIADDHVMFREGLSNMIENSKDFEIVLQADNGKELLEKLERSHNLPDICILDINMPRKNGWHTLQEIKNKWRSVRIIIITSLRSISVAKNVIKNGGNGYLCKNSSMRELTLALYKIHNEGVYLPDNLYNQIFTSIIGHREPDISAKEIQFLEYCCDEYSYKEIAAKMCVSPRTVEGYRDSLFEKLNIHSRTGLAMYALRNGIVSL